MNFQSAMYPVLSSLEMKSIDLETTKRYGISPETLMENAGLLMAQRILQLYGRPDLCFAVLVGAGNNGGDGLVIARHLFHQNRKLKVFVLAEESQFHYPASHNLKIVRALNIPHQMLTTPELWSAHKAELECCDVLVDALLGTGLSGELRPFQKTVIEDVNLKGMPVVAVDVPSGLVNEEDSPNTCALKATHTLAVSVPKVAMVEYPGKEYCGEVHVIDVPFPRALTCYKNFRSYLITDALCREYLPERKPYAHKGDFGHLLVIAGSSAYSGAAVLACRGALRSGCGKVTLASTPACCAVMRHYVPEVITLELAENVNGQITQNSVRFIHSPDQYAAVAYGMGIGFHDDHNVFLAELLEVYPGPLVLDADALNNLSLILNGRSQLAYDKLHLDSRILMTPHVKEASRLMGLDSASFLLRKHFFVRSFVKKYAVNMLVKDAVSLAVFADNSLYYSSKGNEGMATAGSGDVLTGVIASFLAQTNKLERSTILGVHLHGAAGDNAKQRLSSHALLAGDIIDSLASVLSEWEAKASVCSKGLLHTSSQETRH